MVTVQYAHLVHVAAKYENGHFHPCSFQIMCQVKSENGHFHPCNRAFLHICLVKSENGHFHPTGHFVLLPSHILRTGTFTETGILRFEGSEFRMATFIQQTPYDIADFVNKVGGWTSLVIGATVQRKWSWISNLAWIVTTDYTIAVSKYPLDSNSGCSN